MRIIGTKQIIKIQKLRVQGRGYKAIAKSLGISPSTAHKYSKQISLSKRAKLRLVKNQLDREYRFVEVFAKEKSIKKPPLDEKFANVLGRLFFDGSVPRAHNGKYILNYTNSSLEAINSFIKNMNSLFCISPQKVQKFNGINVDWYEVCFMSKNAWKYVKSFSNSFSTKENIGVPKQIKEANAKIQCSFLKAFWDDEGTISHAGYLSGVSKSRRMINDLFLLHQSLGINCSKGINSGSETHVLRVKSDLKNFMLFSEKVGFEHGRVTKGYHLGKFKKDVLQDIISVKVGL